PTAPTPIYTLSLHDALPIYKADSGSARNKRSPRKVSIMAGIKIKRNDRVEVIAGKDKGKQGRVLRVLSDKNRVLVEGVMMVKKQDRKSTRLNSSHVKISYAV